MSKELVCPICGTPLEYEMGYDGDYSCAKCGRAKMFGSEELWQELIRTRKVLDKAKWWLNEIVESHRCTPISTAEMALKEITALEQKDK